MSTRPSLAEFIASRLDARAEALVERWIEWLTTRVGTRTIDALPRDALRNHIPPVLHALAAYVRAPIEAVRAEMLGHLRLHAQMRHHQGYDVQELLVEFDGLAHIVTHTIIAALDGHTSTTAAETIEVFSRLSTGFRAISFVTVGIYRQTETDRREQLALRLEEFARAITHELRNPINTIHLGAELLSRDSVIEDPVNRARHLNVIRQALRRTSDLLDDINILALTEGALAHDSRETLISIVQRIVDELSLSADEKSVSLHVNLNQIPDVEVEALPMQIALINIINNSIKYSDKDKVERWVRLRVHIIEHEENIDSCQVEVEDNGLGIPSIHVERVFQRHVRLHPEVADGTGLGLAITRQLIIERGGRIDLQSVEGAGSTVCFTMPALPRKVLARQRDLSPFSIAQRSIRELLAQEHEHADALDDDASDLRDDVRDLPRHPTPPDDDEPSPDDDEPSLDDDEPSLDDDPAARAAGADPTPADDPRASATSPTPGDAPDDTHPPHLDDLENPRSPALRRLTPRSAPAAPDAPHPAPPDSGEDA